MTWTYEWTRDWGEVWSEEFLREWLSLYDGCGQQKASPFFHPKIVRAWIDSAGGEKSFDPYFLRAKSSDGLTALLPLAHAKASVKGRLYRRLRPAGNNLFDYHEPLLSFEPQRHVEAAVAFWRGLKVDLEKKAGLWFDEIMLPRVRMDLHDSDLSWLKVERAPFLSLAPYDSFEQLLSSRGRKRRSDYGRRLKRLSEQGSVELHVYDKSRCEEILEWLPRLEEERFKRYKTRLPEGYLRRLVSEGLGDSPVHCSALMLNGKSISWHLGFCDKAVVFWYIPAYDPDYGNYSPGKVHLGHMLDWAIRQGYRVFDFMRGEESYKFDWTDGEVFNMYEWSLKSEAFNSSARSYGDRIVNKLIGRTLGSGLIA